MKLFKKDIENYFGEFLFKESDLYKSLMNLGKDEKLVVYYTIDEKNFPNFNYALGRKYTINELIYREKLKFGYENISILQEPFDTQSLFFYYLIQMMASQKAIVNDYPENVRNRIKKDIDNVFLKFKANDLKLARDKELKGSSFEISNKSSFDKALRNFIANQKIIEPLLNITDMVANSFSAVFNRELYGGGLTKVVKALKLPDGRLLPEYLGKMRYMIVGEKSNYAEVEGKNTLLEAKELKRARFSDEEILLRTGWYFNPFDNLWRKKVSDEDYHVKEETLTINQYGKYYEDKNVSEDELFDMFNGDSNILKMMSLGYDGDLKKIISHPKLFEYYPQLQDLKIFYGIFNFVKPSKINKVKEPSYYFTPEKPNFIFFKGNTLIEEEYTQDTILLHEVQHAIQNIEGFATGGNENLAFLIRSVGGGDNIRKFFSGMQYILNSFCNKAEMLNEEELITIMFKFINNKNAFLQNTEKREQLNYFVDDLASKCTSKDRIISNCRNIGLILLHLATESGKGGYIVDIFEDLGIKDTKEIVEIAIQNNKETVKKLEVLKSQGWSSEDIMALKRNYYLFLVGEAESRYVQHASVLTKELEDYFTPYTSEYVPKDYVTVYFENPIEQRNLSAKGGLETYDDNKYVLHLFESYKGVEYLHELGHIVYDVCKSYFPDIEIKAIEVYENLSQEYKSTLENGEEYFCLCFVNYILRNRFEPTLSELNNFLAAQNLVDFDSYFEKVLNLEKATDLSRLKEALAFVKELKILVYG